MEHDNNYDSLEVEILSAAAGVGTSDKLAIEKAAALIALMPIMNVYRKAGFLEGTLIRPIIRKKIAFIQNAVSVTQLKEILKPAKVRYDGRGIQPVGMYAIPEEELILWSETSLRGPLIHEAFQRYEELFRQVFSDQASLIG